MASTQIKKTADLKVVIIGTASVGKTSLIQRYTSGSFQDTKNTIGASFTLKQWGRYNIALWDTAGEERFAGLSSFYARGAGAAILAYDVTDSDTFDALRARFIPLLNSAEEGCLCVVVATKSDLLNTKPRKVPREDGVQLARELNKHSSEIPFYETSALQGSNVTRVFEDIFKVRLDDNPDMVSKLNKQSRSTVDLEKPIPQPRLKCSWC